MTQDEIIEMAIQGHASTRDAIRWAMNQEREQLTDAARQEPLARLIRIMGTFDLATGHADIFDELLDSLESELRDVLGHYREALAQPEQKSVAMADYMALTEKYVALKAAQRTWVGLTDEEVRETCVNEWGGYEQCRAIEAKLKEKNT